MKPTVKTAVNALQVLISLAIPAIYLGSAVTGWKCVSKSDKRPITKSPQKSIMLASLILMLIAIVGAISGMAFLRKNVA
jgi:hypothetical protein